MRYRKKPVIIEATRWLRNGDHPEDACVQSTNGLGATSLSEGRIVRYFRHPGIPGFHRCSRCLQEMHDHGWIDTPEGGATVCPGDWIITGVRGEYYPVKADIFEATYELVKADDPSEQDLP